MKMFRAMLKGAKMKPQCTGNFFKDGGSCALGAISDGANLGLKNSDYAFLMNKFPLLTKPFGARDLVTRIWVLNDEQHWSREAIAEWVKTLEDKITQDKWNARKEQRTKKEDTNAISTVRQERSFVGQFVSK